MPNTKDWLQDVPGSHFNDGDWLFGWFGWLDCEGDERDERDEPSRC